MTAKTKAYAAPSAKSPIEPFSFTRRDVLPNERMLRSDVKYRVVIDIGSLR
jgi:hypothetical protein